MIVESLAAIVGAVVSAYLWETQIRDRVTVKRIQSPDDKDAEGLLDLYDTYFPADGTNYSADEILLFLDSSDDFGADRHVKAENIVLVAKYRNDVVGFIMCHFYRPTKKAIISYFAINRQLMEAKRSASTKLLSRLKRILLDALHPCDYLFFDLQGIEPETPKEEARERKARSVRFRQTAKRLGLPAYLLQFPYACPKVSLDDDSREYPFSLMCIPIQAKLPIPVPRDLVVNFLEFIYLDCYGDLYPMSDERFDPYQQHLQQRIAEYRRTLPAEIGAL